MHSRIDMGHARALLPLSLTKQIEAAHEVARKQLSVREAERLAQRLMKPAGKATAKPDRDILRLQETLSDKLGTTVNIKTGKGGRGKLVIEYDSLDQLDSLIQKF